MRLTNAQFARAAGLQQQVRPVNGYDVHYYASKAPDKAETLVLVHGLGDDKTSFLQAAKPLAAQYNLILVDLAGHGENEKKPGLDYSIHGQMEFLHGFLAAQGITAFHLAGNSMGGHVAEAYALAYPQELRSLTLINAPGVTLDAHQVYAGFGAPVKDQAGLTKLMGRIFYQVPKLPAPIAGYLINQINGSMEFIDRTVIPAIIGETDYDLKDRVAGICTPTLILWGRPDAVVPFNVAEYYTAHIPGARLQVLENASHSPQLEVPGEVAAALLAFLPSARPGR